MGLGASLDNYLKQYFQNIKMSPTFLKWNTKIQGIDAMGICAPWAESFINNQYNYQNIDNKTKMFFLKALDHSLNTCEGVTQWVFLPLGPILTYTTSSFNNLINFLEANQCIDCDRINHKKCHPRHDLP